MPAVGLTMTYDEIRQQVGDHRGYGSQVADWSDDAESLAELTSAQAAAQLSSRTEKSERVRMILKEGASVFYNAYEWSFLQPITELELASGASELVLPWDFGHFRGHIYFTDSGIYGTPLCVQNEGKILLLRQQQTSTTGIPKYAAEVAMEPTQQQGSRRKLIFWPEADQAYSVQACYSVIPDALSTERPHPYGGAVHAITILHSCLAVAEQKDGMMGTYTQLLQQSLAKSIENDRKNKAQSMSAMVRPRGHGSKWPHVGVSTVTYDP